MAKGNGHRGLVEASVSPSGHAPNEANHNSKAKLEERAKKSNTKI
ncbi:hypothetical protein [Bacillus sp. 165]|nr:hypothetical protein [Bacillus sp. 165]